MDTNRDTNPYKLKEKEVDWKEREKAPSGYKDSSMFISYLQKKGVEINREDNLPRFANNNGISMIKITRDGSFGSVPTYYLPPTQTKIEKIISNHRNTNNSLIGREILKKKEEEVLRIFDAAKDRSVSKTSIADQVAKKLGCVCNRKFVKKVLEKKRKKPQLEKKLSKIS